MEEKLIAPCGMNCSVCIAYLGMKSDINRSGFHRKYCPGCVPRGENCTFMSNTCDKLGKGLVRFCFECEHYPCKRLKALDKRYRTKYHMSMLENLECIKEEGIQTFLAKEEAKWNCPECEGTISCHIGLCLNCELDKLISNKKYRWGER